MTWFYLVFFYFYRVSSAETRFVSPPPTAVVVTELFLPSFVSWLIRYDDLIQRNRMFPLLLGGWGITGFVSSSLLDYTSLICRLISLSFLLVVQKDAFLFG